MIGLKKEINDVFIKHNWKLKSNNRFVLIYQQDKREIEIKLKLK